MTAVSFKGTIETTEGACLQAWEPRCSSWLIASVLSDRLSQDNQGQQWPGPQGLHSVAPQSPLQKVTIPSDGQPQGYSAVPTSSPAAHHASLP